ncbi:MAG: hypothetical protein AB7G44_07120 [Bacteroidia bacterium]
MKIKIVRGPVTLFEEEGFEQLSEAGEQKIKELCDNQVISFNIEFHQNVTLAEALESGKPLPSLSKQITVKLE